MPTYFIIEGVKIELYYRDHNPPHFHARIAEYDAAIIIQTGEIMEGSLPPSKTKIVVEWATNNRDILQELWDTLRRMQK